MQSRAVSLYRAILREGRRYPDYNVRNFILRRAKEDFAKHRGLSGEAAAQALAKGESDLELIKRQSIIAGFYKTQASVMEAYEARKAGSK